MQAIPIYIISLKRTPERRLYIQRQLDAFNLEYQWIDAIDAHDFKDTELRRLNLEDAYQPGAMACLLSHVKVYNHIIKNNYETACVLEDDAQLLPSFADILNSKKLQKKKWGILLLAHRPAGTVSKFIKSYYAHTNPPKPRPAHYYEYTLGAIPGNFSSQICKGHYIAKPKQHALSTMGYLVKASAAKKLREIALEHQNRIYIDDIVGDEYISTVSTKIVTPPCIRINPSYIKHSAIRQLDPKHLNPGKLQDEALLHFFMRNKWTTILTQLLMLKRIKLMLKFSIILIRFEWERIQKHFIPKKYYKEKMTHILNRK